jgi:HYR domain
MRRPHACPWVIVSSLATFVPFAFSEEPADRVSSRKPVDRVPHRKPSFSGFRQEAWSVWYLTKYGPIEGPPRLFSTALLAPPVVPVMNLAMDSADVRITAANDRTLTENSIAVHPLDNSTLFCANNATDWDGSQVNNIFGTQVGWSLDGGLTWTSQNEGPGGVGNNGDPAAVIDRSGKFYVGYISNASGQGVSYSTDTGATWTHVTVAPGPPGPFDLLDKNHFAVDNVAASAFVGQAYSAWTEFIDGGANDADIVFSRSLDGGATWSAGVNISNGVAAGSHNQGVNLQVGPNGEVYATWAIYDAFPADETALGFNRSLDGGATWTGEARIITNIRGHRTTALPNTTIRRNSFPSMAVDVSGGPRNGSIYVVWTNVGVPGVNTGDADIYSIRSTDQGATWSTPVRVNTDATTNSQWFPWVSTDPRTGEVYVIFYDRRDDPGDSLATSYVAHSIDGGSTWTNLRVGDVQFTPTPVPGNIAAGYIGDYLGITAKDCQVFPLWSDDRTSFYTAYTSPFNFDETAPSITCPADVVQNNDPGLCSAVVNYPAPTVTDNCPGVTVVCAPPSGSIFPVGTTNVTCTATDSAGATAGCTFNVTVNDAEAPVITSVTASPNVLWPPNHKMVPVVVTATATDNCASSPICQITSVSSDEPVNGLGDGNTAPDWIITGPQTVDLRAERSGRGDGRLYSVTDTCTDGSGNSSSAIVGVEVPHNQ